MGIQALVCVRHNGNWVVAQHCNWDGFPTGQGLTLFKFLREETNVTSLRTGLGYTYEATDEKLAEMNQALRDERERLRRQGPAALYEFVTSRRQFLSALPRGPYGEASAQAYFDVFDLATEMFPSLSRNTGAKVLRLIADANRQNAVPIKLDLEFASDSFQCEWAYIVDLDKEELQIFGGRDINHDTHPFRSAGDWLEVPRLLLTLTFADLQGWDEQRFRWHMRHYH